MGTFSMFNKQKTSQWKYSSRRTNLGIANGHILHTQAQDGQIQKGSILCFSLSLSHPHEVLEADQQLLHPLPRLRTDAEGVLPL